MNDPETSPAHYTSHPIEVIHLSRRLCANLSNVVKYVMRAHLKGAELQDLRKALFYADDLIKTMAMEPVKLACMAEPDFSEVDFTRQMTDGRGRIIHLAWMAVWARNGMYERRRGVQIMRDAIAAEIALMEGEA
jgi:hypothetical protein